MSEPEPKYIVRSALPPIYCLHFWRSGGLDALLCGCEDGKVYSWDLETARTDHTPALTAGSACCLALCSIYDTLITQDRSGRVTLWAQRESAWSPSRTIHLQYSGFCRVSAATEGSGLLVCPRCDGTLEVFSVGTGEKCLVLKNESESQKLGEVMCTKFVRLSGVPYVLVAYENNEVHLWDIRGRSSISKYLVPKCPTALDFDDGSAMGICGTVSNKIPVFRIEKNSTFTTTADVKLPGRGVSCVRIDPGRNYVAVGCWNKHVQLLSWPERAACSPVTLTTHKDIVQDICFSPWPVASWESKCLMAACSKDSQVSLWDFTDSF